MELWDVSFFAIAAPAVVFSGVSKGGFGSGAAFASASILALVLTPGQALGLMLPLLMLIDAASLGPYWGKWDWPAAKLLVLGAIPGVLIGAAVFRATDDNVIRFLIGAMSLLFVLWRIAVSRRWVRPERSQMSRSFGVVIGILSGFASFVSHAGGPPAAVYLLSRKLGKTQYQASTVLVFWLVNIFKAAIYTALGLFTAELLLAGAALAPFALIGTWLGVKAHHLVPERLFFGVTYVLLAATGTKLIYDALS